MSTSSPLLSLPTEIQIEIFIAVDFDTLFTLRATCSKLRNVIDARQKILGYHHAKSDFLGE
jgi:hypothetical protein